jgi:tetratricopeptide (TPR) repeat protein
MISLALRIFRVISFGLVSAGLLLPWFRVPIGVAEKTTNVFAAYFSEPITTIVFKGLVIVVMLSAFLWARFHRDRVSIHAGFRIAAGVLFLAAAIVYPAMTTQRCSSIAAHAAWLEAQHDSLIGPFGDAFTAQEYEHQPGEREVQVKEVFPRAFEVVPTPMITPASGIRLSRLEEILMWLGLSPAFCQFAYWGWYAVLFGAFCMFTAYLRPSDQEIRQSFRLAYGSIPPFLLGSVFTIALCLAPIFVTGWTLSQAQTAAAEGRFADSLRCLDRAQAWLPALAYSTDMLYQRGYLTRRLGLDSPDRRLLDAINEEEAGLFTQAAQHYLDLLDPATQGPVRDEAFRGALRLALKDLNSGLEDRAGSRLSRLLSIDPTSLKANYAMQLVDLRSHRKDQLESDVSQFETVYRTLQSIEKGEVIASAHRRLAYLEFDFQDKAKLGDEMRAAVKPD